MVERLSQLKPVVVVDLDGTLLQCNSMRRFLPFLVKRLTVRFHLWNAIKVICAVGMRSFRLYSHNKMKRQVMRSAKCLTEQDLSLFGLDMARECNHSVTKLIDDFKANGYEILLATAAAEEYVPYIAKACGLTQWVCTPLVDQSGKAYIECRGIDKVKAVQTWIKDNRCYLAVVITDHADDIPLLQANTDGKNYLINPNSKTTAIINTIHLPNLTVIATSRH